MKRLLVIPALVLAFGASACGEVEDYTNAVNAAQDRYAQTMNRLAPQEPGNEVEVAMAEAHRKLAADLRAVEEIPQESRSAHDALVSSVEGQARLLEEASRQ